MGLVVGLAAGGTFAWAAIPNSNTGEITACYPTSGTSKGVLRVINYEAGERCASGEAALSLRKYTPCTDFPRRGVDWRNCDFAYANLSAQNLTSAKLSGANLTGANAGYARFPGAALALTNLTGAILRYADFTNANLTYAKLTNADMQTANLSGANLTGANFTNAWMRSGVRFVGSVGLSSAQIQALRRFSISPSGVQPTCPTSIVVLDSAVFGSLNLTGLNFSTAFLPDVHFEGANLTNANLGCTSMTGANFTGANLTGASLSRAYMCCAAQLKFTNANLRNSNLTSARIEADFTGADLTGANLTGATLVTAVWSNTTCPDGTNSNNNGNTCVGHL